MERVKSMLSTVRFDERFWVEAVSIIYFLRNITPPVSLRLKIFEEVWFDKPLNYSFLYVFDCDAYV